MAKVIKLEATMRVGTVVKVNHSVRRYRTVSSREDVPSMFCVSSTDGEKDLQRPYSTGFSC